LHDNVNQMLSSSKLYMDMALTNKKEATQLIQTSKEILVSAIEEIRSLSRSLVTSSAKDIDLVESVNDLVAMVGLGKSFKIHFEHNRIPPGMSPKLKIAIYRIIQEQINNTIKHAEAKNVAIRITTIKEQVIVTINDDGKGFDPGIKKKGIGLTNILSRTQLFNGHIEIKSAPGKGCRITATIPLIIERKNPTPKNNQYAKPT